MEKFWMLWVIGGGHPTVTHDDRDIACQEAERLARLTGETVVLLEATLYCKLKPVENPVSWRTVGNDTETTECG